MRLKKLITSMAVLGLASSSAFAQEPSEATRAELAALKARLAKMEAALDQNQAGVLQRDPEMARDWFERVTISGQVDTEAWVSDRNPTNISSNDTSYGIDLPSANLYIDAQINRWAKAHVGLHYHTSVSRLANAYAGIYKDESARFGVNNTISNLNVDEAYVTLGYLAKSPVYARLGKQYVPFGDYQRHPITPSFTQLLTQTSAVAAQLGFVMENGLTGSVYTFDGTPKKSKADKVRIRNFGANLAFANSYNDVSYKLGVGYLHNMADVNAVNTALRFGPNGSANLVDRVSAVSVDGSVAFSGFDVSANYVTALDSFNKADLTYKGDGAKPSAVSVDAGYSFPVVNRDSRLGVGYQHSWEVSQLGGNYNMAQDRYLAQYDVEVWKNIDVGVQVYHDRDYDKKDGGTDENNTTGVLRVSAKFA